MSTKLALIVDDDAAWCRIVRITLEIKGFLCHIAHSAQEAVGHCNAYKFDLLILDLGLPDMDGHELLPILKSMHAGTQLKCVVISGMIRKEHQTSTTLAKPLSIDDLVSAVEHNH